MAWERRNGQREYYYRGRREGGRVIKEYVGTGAIGRAAAEHDRIQRMERQAALAAWDAEEAKIEKATAPHIELCTLGTLVARAALLIAGYSRHDRGEWRRRAQARQ